MSRCPECGSAFNCCMELPAGRAGGPDSSTACWCFSMPRLPIPPDAAELASGRLSCLCQNCLGKKIAAQNVLLHIPAEKQEQNQKN